MDWNQSYSRDQLLVFIALSCLVGCGSNGDFIPYSELPAVTMEGIPTTSSDEHRGQKNANPSPTDGSAAADSKDASTDSPAPDTSAAPSSGNSVTPTSEARSLVTVPGSNESGLTGTKPAEAAGSETGVVLGSAAEVKTVVSSQTGLVGPADVPQIENTAGEVREIKLLIPEKKFPKERGTTALRVSYDDIDLLKVLNMEPVPADAAEHFPGWLQELNGKPVRIRGFMYPTFEATGLTEFTMARDNGICCFVRKPKIYDIIGVTLAEGVTTDYIEGRPFDIEGTFHIEPEGDEYGLYRLYRISNARVIR